MARALCRYVQLAGCAHAHRLESGTGDMREMPECGASVPHRNAGIRLRDPRFKTSARCGSINSVNPVRNLAGRQARFLLGTTEVELTCMRNQSKTLIHTGHDRDRDLFLTG